ncbi:hypothetical protein BS78_04G044600 [Paspalum vaginatum]|nr:hypothetical protein BS78_04G044600 [Paspalum vaginatum]
MAMSAFRPTSALSSLEAMLYSLMRGSGGGGGDYTPADDTRASPLPPPQPRRCRRGRSRGAGDEEEDAGDDAVSVSLLVEGLERKAVEVEARLRQKEEENAALKRRMEGYHIRWLEYEIRIKSLEEAFHEQMAALQMAQDAARRARETAYGDAEMSSSEEPAAPVRLRHGRDRLLVTGACRRGRLGAEFRWQSHTLERAEAPPGPWQPAAPSANAAEDLKKLKAQFRAWTKDYKARLRRAEAGRDRRRGGSCWI